MPALVIVGAQWGDEGKGKIVHLLSKKADFVARYQGGNNAGHTVVDKGVRYALHLVPSGVLYPKVKGVIGNGVVLDPTALKKELEDLAKVGIKSDGRILVSLATHVILPYHILLDTEREGGSDSLGTTKRGIGPCYEDKIGRVGIRVCDFLEPETFKKLLAQNLKRHENVLSRFKPVDQISREILSSYEALKRFLEPLAHDTSAILDEALKRGKKVIFESAQGAMLDMDYGTYPFVTASNPITGGAAVGTGVAPRFLDKVLAITKAYTTRVGHGPFPTQLDGPIGDKIREVGHEYGTTTGRPRRVGWLDLVPLRSAIRVNGVTSFAMMKLDTLSGINPLRVCTAYRYKGKLLKEFPLSREARENAEPVYEDFPGFEGDLTKVRKFEDLPKTARSYVLAIERKLGVPIEIVSVGPGREQTILRRQSAGKGSLGNGTFSFS